MKEFFTLDDFNLEDKYVAVRIDLNSDVINNKVIPNERFERHSRTIKELIEKNAKVILLAHQSRKGEPDFISLEQHAKILSNILKEYLKDDRFEIKFVNDIIGEKAENEIKKLKSGEVLLLDNVRFLEDEDIEKSFEEHRESSLVRFLSKFIDYFVLDAFSVAHRSHASIVGFAEIVPNIIGRVMQEEIESINKVLTPLGINAWLLGGAKIDDIIPILDHMFKNRPESIEKVLCGGLLANIFLLAKGYEIGNRSKEILEKKGLIKLIDKAKELYHKYYKEIELPDDVAIEYNGERKEISIENIPKDALILDIGSETIEKYKSILKHCRSVIIKGPMGMFEKQGFEKGTKELFEYIANLDDIISLVGGGDSSIAIDILKIPKKFTYISIGGGALLNYLSGKKMPGIEALKTSYIKFLNLKK
ncbi:MAG: phosphoglycerate kinase [Candidatus Aenigmatarchaeota archaeon]